MFERVLVPIDASAESLLALPLARRVAEATGARLCPLRISPVYEHDASGSRDDGRRFATGALGPSSSQPTDEAILRVGHASDIPAAIVAEARASGADLIVLATHARSGFDRLTHPRAAEAVLGAAPVPVLLVNAARDRLAADAAAPILVAVDGSPEGARALPLATRYARALDAELFLLRVLAPQFADGGVPVSRRDSAALDDAQRYLDRLVARVPGGDVRAQGRALVGPVAATIAAVAEQIDAGAIVLSAHNVRGAARLVGGGVAAGLLRAESRPMLLVRRGIAGGTRPVDAARDGLAARRVVGADATPGGA